MPDNDTNPALRPRDAAEDRAARRPPAWTTTYPPGRDALQRLADKRMAEKRRAAQLRRTQRGSANVT